MIEVVRMQAGIEELRDAEEALKKFSESVVMMMMKEADELHGNLTRKLKIDIDEIAEGMRRFVMIGAAACGILANAIEVKKAKEAGRDE